MIKFLFIVFFIAVIKETGGHGMMIDPPNRSSVWRYYSGYPVNYNDNENFCGGAGILHGSNGGKCGLCGDNYVLPHPQPNEHTGKYGRGLIVANYTSESEIYVTIKLTANHLGTFQYSVCKINNENAPEPGENCFVPLTLSDGSEMYNVGAGEYSIVNGIQLPAGLTCNRCVLRWHYRAGNSWGTCEDGSGALGCGPQETFRNCADISIV